MDSEIDEYLPPQTLDWCDNQLEEAGYSLPIGGGDYNQDTGDKLHLQAYRLLRDAARSHIRERRVPTLSESPKPYEAFGWQPSEDLQKVYAYAGVELRFADECTDRELQAFYEAPSAAV